MNGDSCWAIVQPEVVTLGENIKRLQARARITTKELARRAGVKPAVVSGWRTDRRGLPETPTLFKLAKSLKCSVEDLLEGVDQDYEELRRRAAKGAMERIQLNLKRVRHELAPKLFAEVEAGKCSPEAALAIFDELINAMRPLTSIQGAADHPPTAIAGFVALPLLANPIAAGQPLAIAPDPERDRTLSFRETVVRKFTRPICLRIGPREESMLPTLEPGDVVVIDQDPNRRRSPKAGHIYAVNFGPLSGDDGGAAKRIELSGGMLVVTSDNMNKQEYPTQVFNVTDVNLLDALVGEVVWTGRYLGSGKKAGVRNMKRKRVSA